MSGLSGLGSSFLADLRGTVMHCVQYGKGKKKKIICSKFGPGAGAPNMAARRRAGVKGKFRERSRKMLKQHKPRRPGAKKRCVRFYRSGAKKGKCMTFAPTGKALKSARTMQEGRVCERYYKSGKRKGKCAKFRMKGEKPAAKRRPGRKKSRKKTAKRKPAAKSTRKRKTGKKKTKAKKSTSKAKKSTKKRKKSTTKSKKKTTKKRKSGKKKSTSKRKKKK